MSGRIRTIKPELLEDAVTAGLSDTAFRLFIACILLADDYGNLRFEPEWLRGQVFWLRKVDSELFSSAVEELAVLVTAYEVKGQRYGAIKNWAKHQKVSHPGKPRVPSLADALPKVSGDPRESLVPDLRSPTPTTTPTPKGERRVSAGASGVEAKAVFESAVSDATGRRFTLGSAPFHVRDLCDAVNEHAPPGSTTEALEWLRTTTAAWLAVLEPKATVLPSKFLEWLNAGKPDRRARGRPNAIVQPGDNRAWKVPEDMP